MDATGNLLLLLNGLERSFTDDQLVAISKKALDHVSGLGGDQLLVVTKPDNDQAHFNMKIFNADGSEVEMCGNGLRAFAKYLSDNNLILPSLRNQPLTISTRGGLVQTEILTQPNLNDILYVKVDMGQPRILNSSLSVKVKFDAEEITLNGAYISMGNPHYVVVLDAERITDRWVKEVGPQVENNPQFEHKTNVEFIAFNQDGSLTMRVWERGCGETLSCGSGACAVVTAVVSLYKKSPSLDIHTRGGLLTLHWDIEKTNHIFKTGPVKTLFSKQFTF